MLAGSPRRRTARSAGRCDPGWRRARPARRRRVPPAPAGTMSISVRPARSCVSADRFLPLLHRAAEHIDIEFLERRRIGRAQHHMIDAENAERGRHAINPSRSAELRRLQIIVRLDDLDAAGPRSERSPPLASGWWRFTSSLKRALISAAAASISSPSVSNALRSALRTVRASGAGRSARAAAPPGPNSRSTSNGSVAPAAAEPVDAAVEAHLPGRPVAGDGVLLVARDRIVAHAGEIIVGMVVLAHVLEAEAPVLVLAQRGPSAPDASPRRRSPATGKPALAARPAVLPRA